MPFKSAMAGKKTKRQLCNGAVATRAVRSDHGSRDALRHRLAQDDVPHRDAKSNRGQMRVRLLGRALEPQRAGARLIGPSWLVVPPGRRTTAREFYLTPECAASSTSFGSGT